MSTNYLNIKEFNIQCLCVYMFGIHEYKCPQIFHYNPIRHPSNTYRIFGIFLVMRTI